MVLRYHTPNVVIPLEEQVHMVMEGKAVGILGAGTGKRVWADYFHLNFSLWYDNFIVHFS